MITSTRNPNVKRWRGLRQKKNRLREGLGLAEGIRLVLSALEAAPDLVDEVVFSPELLVSTTAQAAIAHFEAAGRPVRVLSAAAFQAISDRDKPTGLAAVIRSPLRPAAELPDDPGGLTVALEEIGDPGNLGTILRTLDALGASACILVGQTTDLLHPAALRASLGSLFAVPTAALDSPEALLAWSEGRAHYRLATSAAGGRDLREITPRWPVLLMMGSEQNGLSSPLRAAAHEQIRIPMQGTASSLNLAIATAIAVFEIGRHKLPANLPSHQTPA